LAAYLLKNQRNMSAEQAINKINKIREDKSIQSKDQERIVFNYEKYLKNETRKEREEQ
jgi:hypothetical protein